MNLVVNQDFFAALPDPCILTDQDWNILFLNRRAEELFQVPAAEVVRRCLWTLSERADFENCHREAMSGPGEPPVISVPVDGIPVWFEIHVSAASFGAVIQYRNVSAQRQLAEMYNRYTAVIDSADDAIITEDLAGTILSWNKGAERLLGYTAEEILGQNVALLAAPGRRDEAPLILERVARGERVEHYETKRRARDGQILTVSLTVSPVRDASGTIVAASKIARDISARTEVAELHQRLSAIIESSDDAVLSKDLDGIIRSWNRGAEKVFGYTPEEAIGQHISMLAAPDVIDEIPDILARIRRGERVDHYETKRKDKNGRIITVSLTVSPIRDLAGNVIGASKVARDITESNRVQELQEHLAAIVASSDDAIISKDLNGFVLTWNRGAEKLFGYTAEEVVGKHIAMLAPAEVADEIPRILDRIRNGELVDHYQTKRRTKGGKILTVSLTVSPVRDASGRIIGASKVARDISEREQHEEEMKDANTALTRSNEDLQQFVYSASHDLQEPLRMISAYGELLSKKYSGRLDTAGETYLRYVTQGALRMEHLLRDLRAYTRASTVEQEAVTDIDVRAVLETVVGNLEFLISENEAVLEIGPMPSVRMHAFHLEQVFQNLISNAIRYRGPAKPAIQISASREGSVWLFAVRDNGMGIEARYLEQIFGIFKRLHNSSEHQGTGMGLAICQRIINRAGGRIWAESTPGEGSVFLFTVPA